jgi:hypothetical protein
VYRVFNFFFGVPAERGAPTLPEFGRVVKVE